MTAAYPALPQARVILRLRGERPRTGFAYGRFIAERDGGPIGYLGWIHGPWEKVPDRHCEVEVWLDQKHLDPQVLIAMFTWIGDLASSEGSRLLMSYCAEDEPEMLDSLAALGYKRERIERCSELNLREHVLPEISACPRDRVDQLHVYAPCVSRPRPGQGGQAPRSRPGSRAWRAQRLHRQRLQERAHASHQPTARLRAPPGICRAPQAGN